MGRILGIDYGKAKVGLAIADAEIGIAFSHGMLRNDKDFLERLMKIIKDEDADMIVIGIPSYVNREETEYDGEKLGKYLADHTDAAIEYHDEMFSTKIARENLKEKGMKNLNAYDDAESAKVILQSWLDKKK